MPRISLITKGATTAQIARGIPAARAVVDEAGVAPLDAASAHLQREGWVPSVLNPSETAVMLAAAAVLHSSSRNAWPACGPRRITGSRRASSK